MNEATAIAGERQSVWRRILNFPLVSLVLAIAAYALGVILSAAIAKYLVPPIPGFTPNMKFDLVGIVVLVAIYKLVIRHLGEQPRDDLPARNAVRDLGLGLLAGFVIFSLVVGLAALVGVYRIVGQGDTSALVLALIGTAVLPGFMEELLFRGILFRWIEEFGGSWAALFVTSALFGLAHIFNPNATWFSSFAIAVEAGVLLGGVYMLTRSLWAPMGLHAAWNFTQGEIFDVPVSGLDSHGLVQARLSGPDLLSGGQFGLEASLLALIVATAAGLWMVWAAVRRGELVQPWWTRRRAAVPAAA